MDTTTPPRLTCEIEQAARIQIELQRARFEAMPSGMNADCNCEHFDRKAPLGELFQLMGRDEARHGGVLNRALAAEGIAIDSAGCPGRRSTWTPVPSSACTIRLVSSWPQAGVGVRGPVELSQRGGQA